MTAPTLPKMHARVCRYKMMRQSPWENGILVCVDTPDERERGKPSDSTETIIGSNGEVYYPADIWSYDALGHYGAFTFNPGSP